MNRIPKMLGVPSLRGIMGNPAASQAFVRSAVSALCTRSFSTTNPEAAAEVEKRKRITDVTQLDLQNHDAVKVFGEEKWKALVEQAAHNSNVVLRHKDVSVSATSLDSTMSPYSSFTVTPGSIHEAFRDLSAVPKAEAKQRFIDLFLTAVNMDLEAKRDRVVARWLFFVAFLVFIMVVVGGLTRLTKSGLSMVHWKFTGEKRPTNQEEWEAEFARYKESPEYKLHNEGMSLEDFKFIYHMEYGHRSLGRVIGLVFTLPFLYFLATKRVTLKSGLGKGLLVALGLGALQGGIGWWMVKSGLNEEDNKVKAKVSPYRLATHLITAFTLFTLLGVLGMRAGNGRVATYLRGQRVKAQDYLASYNPTSLSHALAMMTFFTAASGAFVAGNEAGLVYNEFPLMGGQVVPDDIINPYMTPAWKNIFENSVTVQFIHRCLAISTWSLAVFTAMRCGLTPTTLPKISTAAHLTAGAATLQATLGITTLLMGVPVHVAAAHQAGAMILLACALRFMFLTKNPVFALGSVAAQLEAAHDQRMENQKRQKEDVDAALARLTLDPETAKLLEQARRELADQAQSVRTPAAENKEKDGKKDTTTQAGIAALLVGMGLIDEEDLQLDETEEKETAKL